MIALVGLLACVPLLAHHDAGAARYRFTLQKGAGTPVCDAYVRRLEASDFLRPPYCDRPENDAVPGFARLNRLFLDVAEVARLQPQVTGFVLRRDRHALEKIDAERQRLGAPARNPERERAIIETYLSSAGPLDKHFKFAPAVDVDNDGTPDDLVVWRDTGTVCGAVSGAGPFPRRAATYVLVLDKQGDVDEIRTEKIFGHPEGPLMVQFSDGVRAQSQRSDAFRPVGSTVGVFAYRGETYFDTFVGGAGDMNNGRAPSAPLSNTLTVMKHQGGGTQLVCELLWREPKK